MYVGPRSIIYDMGFVVKEGMQNTQEQPPIIIKCPYVPEEAHREAEVLSILQDPELSPAIPRLLDSFTPTLDRMPYSISPSYFSHYSLIPVHVRIGEPPFPFLILEKKQDSMTLDSLLYQHDPHYRTICTDVELGFKDHQRRGKNPVSNVILLAKYLTEVVRSLHCLGIAHLNLTPENILLSLYLARDYLTSSHPFSSSPLCHMNDTSLLEENVFLIDFGTAVSFPIGRIGDHTKVFPILRDTIYGQPTIYTSYYAPPEYTDNRLQSPDIPAIDTYSLGITFEQLMTVLVDPEEEKRIGTKLTKCLRELFSSMREKNRANRSSLANVIHSLSVILDDIM